MVSLNEATDKLAELDYRLEASSSSMRAAASMMAFVLNHPNKPAFILDDPGVLEIIGSTAAAGPTQPSSRRGATATPAPAPVSAVGRAPDHLDFCEDMTHDMTFGAARSSDGLFSHLSFSRMTAAIRYIFLMAAVIHYIPCDDSGNTLHFFMTAQCISMQS